MRVASAALIFVGLALAVFSFLSLSSAALPYQDPTPELLLHQASEVGKWRAGLVVGASLAALGAVGFWRYGRRRFTRDQNHNTATTNVP